MVFSYDDFIINIEICLNRKLKGFHIDDSCTGFSRFYVRVIGNDMFIIGNDSISFCFDSYEDDGNHITFYRNDMTIGLLNKEGLVVRDPEEASA